MGKELAASLVFVSVCLLLYGEGIEATDKPNLKPAALNNLAATLARSEWEVLEFTRILENRGFHRDLRTNFTLSRDPNGRNDGPSLCTVVIAEIVDEAFYVDKFQVEEIRRLGGESAPFVFFFDEFDLERASSHPDVLVRGKIPVLIILPPFSTSSTTTLDLAASLPIHARYQPPSEDRTHILLTVQDPLLFIHCVPSTAIPQTPQMIVSALLGQTTDSFQSLRIPRHQKPGWEVPVGQLQHKEVVMTVTLAATTSASLFVLYCLCKHSSPVL